MPNYNSGKIYKIWSPSHPDDIYIGSTTQPLSKRIGGHRVKYKRYQNGKYPYMTSFKILEYGDARIELIQDCKCERREQLLAREGHFIRTLDCVNTVTVGRTRKQHYQDNKEKILQKKKQWDEANRDKIKQYYQDNKERIAQYKQDNKERISQQNKQYRVANRDKMLQKSKQYYQANKQKINEKVKCECGSIIARRSLTAHKKTNKHKRLLQALNTTTQSAAQSLHCYFR